MNKNKRQKFKAGAIVKIVLHNNLVAFGRLMPGVASIICVYDLVVNKDVNPSIEEIVRNRTLFCCGLFREIIMKGSFEIIGFQQVSDEDMLKLCPSFKQDLVNIHDCVIFWPMGGERKATPEECIGLERASVWSEISLIERIEDYYAGRKNFNVEQQKVILSKDDPRYLAMPGTLRWDFEKQKFYRTS